MAYDIGTATGMSNDEIAKAIQSSSFDMFGTLASCVIWGDSITDQNRLEVDSVVSLPNRGYFNWLNTLIGKKFKLLNNAGVSGETVEEIYSRFDADVAAYNPKYVFIFAGMNDVIGGVDVDTTTSFLSQCYSSIESIGAKVIAFTVYSTSSINEANESLRQELNRWIMSEARSRGHLLVDTASALLNPSNEVYPYEVADTKYDGLHPNNYGAYLIAKSAVSDVESAIPGRAILLPSTSDDPSNMVTNPINVGDGGSMNNGSSGECPDDFSTFISSLPSGSSLVGSIEAGTNYRTYRVTLAGTESFASFHRPTCDSPISGDEYYAILEYDADLVDCEYVYLKLRSLGGSDPKEAYDNRSLTTGETDIPSVVVTDGVLITPSVLNDDSSTSLVVDVFVKAVSGTLDIKRISVLKVSG